MAVEKVPCFICKKMVAAEGLMQHKLAKHTAKKVKAATDDTPNWKGRCEVCGQSPTHPLTGMCGPCTFGEADTMGGNW